MSTLSREKADFIRGLMVDDRIDPEVVTEAARNPKCVLHDEYVWDVEDAARQQWRDTSQRLIRMVRLEVTIEREVVVAPYYVPQPNREPKTRTYIALTSASRDRTMAQQVLLAELDRIGAAIRRSREVAAVLGLTDQLEGLLLDVTTLKSRAERRREERKPPPRRSRRRGAAEARA